MFGRFARRAGCLPLITACFLAAGLSQADAKRLALVVGNADYTSVPALKNAVRDATDIADVLERLGFEVTLLTDVRTADFWHRIETFSLDAKSAEATVFYYSGHAFQMNGANYLVPVDATLTSRNAIRDETWNLDGIIALLQDRKRQTLIFLDACRDDPLPPSVRGSAASDGLARLQTGVGTFVAFATAPGAVTYDGAGTAPNSPFATALLDNLEKPGLSVSDMMINVRNEVEERTLRRQTPWDQSSLREQFYFNPEVETKQELSAADYELLAQLAPEDRKKFLDLLRASGFSEASLKAADAAIEVAGLNLEMAADSGGVTIGAPADPTIAGPTVGDALQAVGPPPPVAEDTVLELATVDGGVTIGDAPDPQLQIASAQTQALTPRASAAPPSATTSPVAAARGPGPAPKAVDTSTQPRAPSVSIASVQETNPALLRNAENADATTDRDDAPIRLAALTWQTRGIAAINAVSTSPIRVSGNVVTPDNAVNRAILKGIDPALLQDAPVATGSGNDARDAQRELRRLGCYQMAVDGSWGGGSRAALTSYYLARHQIPASLEPSLALVEQLRDESVVVCEVRVARVKQRVKVAPTLASDAQTAAKPRISKRTGRVLNAPAKVKKEIRKSLLGSGSF